MNLYLCFTNAKSDAAFFQIHSENMLHFRVKFMYIVDSFNYNMSDY